MWHQAINAPINTDWNSSFDRRRPGCLGCALDMFAYLFVVIFVLLFEH